MNHPLRTLATLATSTAAVSCTSGVLAQPYPTKPVRVVARIEHSPFIISVRHALTKPAMMVSPLAAEPFHAVICKDVGTSAKIVKDARLKLD